MNKYQEAFKLFGKSLENPMDNFTMDELIELNEAVKVFQELVDRATPKKIEDKILWRDGIRYGYCPNCGAFDDYGKFCPNCGQALEWEQGEKK